MVAAKSNWNRQQQWNEFLIKFKEYVDDYTLETHPWFCRSAPTTMLLDACLADNTLPKLSIEWVQAQCVKSGGETPLTTTTNSEGEKEFSDFEITSHEIRLATSISHEISSNKRVVEVTVSNFHLS